jgi:hypothetical protein
VSLNEGDLAAYRVTLDRQGAQTSKERLRGPAGTIARGRAAPRPSPGESGTPARAGGPPPLPPFPAAISSPIPRPNTSLQPATGTPSNLCSMQHPPCLPERRARGSAIPLRVRLRRLRSVVSLYVGGTGEVRFKDVSRKDLQPRVAQPEKVSSKFRNADVNEFYYSWGPAVADFNRDGTPDIVAGPYYYLGPEYNRARENLHRRDDRSRNRILQRPAVRLRLHGRGWPDVLNSIFQREAILYVNPRESRAAGTAMS